METVIEALRDCSEGAVTDRAVKTTMLFELYKAPILYSLAKQLVQDIFDWKPPARRRRNRTTTPAAANTVNEDEATTATATAK